MFEKLNVEELEIHIDRHVDEFMSNYPFQYSLFGTIEEQDDAYRDIVKEGVISGYVQISAQMGLLKSMQDLCSSLETK